MIPDSGLLFWATLYCCVPMVIQRLRPYRLQLGVINKFAFAYKLLRYMYFQQTFILILSIFLSVFKGFCFTFALHVDNCNARTFFLWYVVNLLLMMMTTTTTTMMMIINLRGQPSTMHSIITGWPKKVSH